MVCIAPIVCLHYSIPAPKSHIIQVSGSGNPNSSSLLAAGCMLLPMGPGIDLRPYIYTEASALRRRRGSQRRRALSRRSRAATGLRRPQARARAELRRLRRCRRFVRRAARALFRQRESRRPLADLGGARVRRSAAAHRASQTGLHRAVLPAGRSDGLLPPHSGGVSTGLRGAGWWSAARTDVRAGQPCGPPTRCAMEESCSRPTANCSHVYPDGSGVESYRCDHGPARGGARELASGDILFETGGKLARFTSARAVQLPVAMPAGEYAGPVAELSPGVWLLSFRGASTAPFGLVRWRAGDAAPGKPMPPAAQAAPPVQAVQPVLVKQRPVPKRFPSALGNREGANLLCLNVYTSKLRIAAGFGRQGARLGA